MRKIQLYTNYQTGTKTITVERMLNSRSYKYTNNRMQRLLSLFNASYIVGNTYYDPISDLAVTTWKI